MDRGRGEDLRDVIVAEVHRAGDRLDVARDSLAVTVGVHVPRLQEPLEPPERRDVLGRRRRLLRHDLAARAAKPTLDPHLVQPAQIMRSENTSSRGPAGASTAALPTAANRTDSPTAAAIDAMTLTRAPDGTRTAGSRRGGP